MWQDQVKWGKLFDIHNNLELNWFKQWKALLQHYNLLLTGNCYFHFILLFDKPNVTFILSFVLTTFSVNSCVSSSNHFKMMITCCQGIAMCSWFSLKKTRNFKMANEKHGSNNNFVPFMIAFIVYSIKQFQV